MKAIFPIYLETEELLRGGLRVILLQHSSDLSVLLLIPSSLAVWKLKFVCVIQC
jgi:hypothetical protein